MSRHLDQSRSSVPPPSDAGLPRGPSRSRGTHRPSATTVVGTVVLAVSVIAFFLIAIATAPPSLAIPTAIVFIASVVLGSLAVRLNLSLEGRAPVTLTGPQSLGSWNARWRSRAANARDDRSGLAHS